MNYILIIAAFLLGLAVMYGLLTMRGKTFEGALEVTQDSKSIFNLDLWIEPEKLAERDHISIMVVRKGPPVS